MASGDGREVRTVQLRLNLNKDVELGMYEYLKELARTRERKSFLMEGVELAHAKREGDFERLMELLPEFTHFIRAQTLAEYQSPANREFETMLYHESISHPAPLDAPTVEDETEADVVPEEDFDMFSDLEI